jgi:hypothetical protein
MRPVPAPRFALVVASLLAGPALVGGGCNVVLDLPEYTLCGPRGQGGCGGAGGGDGGHDGGAQGGHADH